MRFGGGRYKVKRAIQIMAASTLAAMIAAPLPAQAGQAELDLLSSYIGNWRGEGLMTGGDFPENFKCRLTIAKGNATKINYAGRCTLVNANISISGTIAYNDSTRRYEAAMSSNAGFTGLAIGMIDKNQISFDLKERQKDRAGSDVRIGSKIQLANDNITVNFEIEFNESGQVLTSSVPFKR